MISPEYFPVVRMLLIKETKYLNKNLVSPTTHTAILFFSVTELSLFIYSY